MDDEERAGETLKSGTPTSTSPTMTLQKAVDMGEYEPDFLATFPEWHTVSRHIQFQYIKQALDNRVRQLDVQYAAICNVLDFSKKPQLQEALRNIESQITKIREDRERLLVEYSG